MSSRRILLSIVTAVVFLLCFSISVLAKNPDIGYVKVESTGVNYSSISEALTNASTTDTLIVSGDVEVPANFTLGKNITLKSADGGGRLFTKSPTDAVTINVDNGNTLTLGSGSSSNELLMEGIHVKVTGGKLNVKDGVHIKSNLRPLSIIEISGKMSSANFEGGVVENLNENINTFNNSYIVSVFGGSTVESISGGTFRGAYIAFNVYGDGTKINSITGGHFSNSQASRQSEPCFKLSKKAHIGKISGGEFLTHRFGALQLESGASIDEISGGTFKNLLTTDVAPASWARPYFSGLVLYGRTVGSPQVNEPVKVDKISGGYFEGVNGILAVGNTPEMKAVINQVTGGTFIGKESAGLYFTQNSEVGLLSGSIVSKGSKNGIWNAGTISKIDGGTYTGEDSDGLQNINLTRAGTEYKYFAGNIKEINGGIFNGSKRGLYNSGTVGTINNGNFNGNRYAIYCDNHADFGDLNIIRNGVFYAKNGRCCIYLVKNLKLEPGLSNEEFGFGRYFAPEKKPIFNNDKLVTFPKYSDPENKNVMLEYFMSYPDDTKMDVKAFDNVGFRFLRQKIKIKYNYNLGKNPAEKIGKYLNPKENAIIWNDTSEFGDSPKGYKFKGWNTKADGSGISYSGGDTIKNITKDIKLYAIWEKIETPAVTPPAKPAVTPPTTHSVKTGDSSITLILLSITFVLALGLVTSVQLRRKIH